MRKFYFVVYELTIQGQRQAVENVIIQKHPVEWAAFRPDSSMKTRLLFWQEIPESIALSTEVRKAFAVEGAINDQATTPEQVEF